VGLKKVRTTMNNFVLMSFCSGLVRRSSQEFVGIAFAQHFHTEKPTAEAGKPMKKASYNFKCVIFLSFVAE
jgi:hypothetical protein